MCRPCSGTALMAFVTLAWRSHVENPALDRECGQSYFCSLTDGSAPGGRREREASWTSLVTAIARHMRGARNTKSRCLLAKVKRRTLGCVQMGLTGPQGGGMATEVHDAEEWAPGKETGAGRWGFSPLCMLQQSWGLV